MNNNYETVVTPHAIVTQGDPLRSIVGDTCATDNCKNKDKDQLVLEFLCIFIIQI